jgi:hypothetical protein
MELKVQSAKDKQTLDESIYTRNKKIKSLEGISEVDFERFELAFKSSKLNYESAKKAISTTKSTIENDQERNNINLKYSQNKMIIVLKVL